MPGLHYTKNFALNIEPRFAKGIKPIVLEWLAPQSREQTLAERYDPRRNANYFQ